MAPNSWALTVLGLTTLASGLALPLPQESTTATVDDETVAYWCPDINYDLSNPDVVHKLWTYSDEVVPRKIVSVGTALAGFAENVVGSGVKNDRWADVMMDIVAPGTGNTKIGGCGVPGGECAPDVDCKDLARKGMGNLYWALQALTGMHHKLDIAHEMLQDSTIVNTLSLSEIAKDFTAPPAVNALDTLASLLGVALYFVGGAAGMGGVAAGLAGTARAAATASRVGVLRQHKDFALKNNAPETAAKLDNAIANAERNMAKLKEGPAAVSGSLGTLGSSTYFMGGTFGIIGAGLDPPTTYQITGDDLEVQLRNMFIQASEQLNATGLMAAGHAGKDTDYSLLPGVKDDAGYWEDNAIANFYSNGKFLLSETDTTFREGIQATFDTFKPKIVDYALVASGWKILAETGWENTQTDSPEQACLDAYGFGTRFIDNLCVNLWQDVPDGETCEGGQDRCYNRKMSEDQHKALTDKYKFDIWTYYAAQMDCGKAKGKPGEPDIYELPENGETPLCWFSVPAQKGAFEYRGGADEPGDNYWTEAGW